MKKRINNIRRCRLCAREESFNNFLNIFDDNPDLDLEIKISKLLPVVVMPWDPMPHIVCKDCICKLNSFNDFYEASLKAERFLRTFHLSAPENELEIVDPVSQVTDSTTDNSKTSKLPQKKCPSTDKTSTEEIRTTEPRDKFEDIPESRDERDDHDVPLPKRALDSFIINHITTRDSVFTCRDCYRTFTKQSTALTHSCVNLDDCEMLKTLGMTEDGTEDEKALPPLKIRLFSIRSGLFICYLCQTSFESKTELMEHLKRHFDDRNWETEIRKKCKQTGKKRGQHKEGDDSEDTQRKKTPAKRKRKCTETPKRKGKKKIGEETVDSRQNGTCEICEKAEDSSKETMEQMTQCSEVVSSSEVKEVEVEVEENSVEILPINRTDPEKETDVSGIFETTWSPASLLSDNVESPQGDKSDEVTVLEVIDNKTPTSFSSCVFCDKIFATKDALIAHQNKHLQDYSGGLKSVTGEETFFCSVCAMCLTSKKTLLEHEQFHRVEGDPVEKIRIAFNPETLEADVGQECQISKGRGILTITVTSREKKTPQIELI